MLLRTGDQGAEGQGAGADQEEVGTQKDGGKGRQADEEGALGQGRLNWERQHGVRFLVYYNHQRGRDGISEAWRGVDRRWCYSSGYSRCKRVATSLARKYWR
jgi:hypothetical protein